jgi:hypothetical protein
MNTKKFLTGTLVGGVALFFLGYLFYGMALSSFFSQHSTAPSGAMKPMAEMIWWALILGNLASAALLTYIFLKMGNVKSIADGAKTGGAIGLLLALSVDLVRYATENSFDLTGLFADVVVFTVMNAIAGGMIAAFLGMGAKKA